MSDIWSDLYNDDREGLLRVIKYGVLNMPRFAAKPTTLMALMKWVASEEKKLDASGRAEPEMSTEPPYQGSPQQEGG